MKFTVAIFAIATTTLPVLSTPVAEPQLATDVGKRDHTIYVCSGEYAPFIFKLISADAHNVSDYCDRRNWTGQCVTYTPPYNQCEPFSALGVSGLGSWAPLRVRVSARLSPKSADLPATQAPIAYGTIRLAAIAQQPPPTPSAIRATPASQSTGSTTPSPGSAFSKLATLQRRPFGLRS